MNLICFGQRPAARAVSAVDSMRNVRGSVSEPDGRGKLDVEETAGIYSPHFVLVWILRPSKAIYVSSMFSYKNKSLKVVLN